MQDPLRLVRLTRFFAPFHSGEAAAFPVERARDLVRRGIAVFDPPDPDAMQDSVATMNRQQMIAFARQHLGLPDEPPEEVTDDQIRQAILADLQHRASTGNEEDDTALAGGIVVAPALDQLDAMDRIHLEAYAESKLGLETIDPTLTDDELRAQIRTLAEVASRG